MSDAISSPTTQQNISSGFIFYSAHNSNVKLTQLHTGDVPSSKALELSKEQIFRNNRPRIFTKQYVKLVTINTKHALLKEMRDCIIHGDKQPGKVFILYSFSYWRGLHVWPDSLCIVERVEIHLNIQKEFL